MKISLLLLALMGVISACPDEDYCARCDVGSKTCLQCENVAFNVQSKKCDEKQKPIANCRIYSRTEPLVCLRCAFGFGVSADSKQCVKCQVQGCAECNFDAQTCSACFSPKVLGSDFKSCVDDAEVKNPDCEVNNSNQNFKRPFCLACKEKFSLVNGECKAEKIPFCAEAVNDACYACRAGYFQTADGKCSANGSGGNKEPSSKKWVWFLVLFLLIAAGAAYWFFMIRPNQGAVRQGEPLIA